MNNVLVTGVSRGLGLEIVKVLLKSGYKVYGVARNRTIDIEDLLNNYKNEFKFKEVDLSDPDLAKLAIFHKDFINFETPLIALVNNAAIAYDDIITNLNIDKLEKMYKINVFTPMLLTKYSIRSMLLNSIKGSIVHISSISVHTGYKGLAMYASSKGALEAFSKNTAREWGGKGIRSNCLVAGFMETSMSDSLKIEQKQRIYNRTSLKEATSLESVAKTIKYLISNDARSITGQNMFVDSGTI